METTRRKFIGSSLFGALAAWLGSRTVKAQPKPATCSMPEPKRAYIEQKSPYYLGKITEVKADDIYSVILHSDRPTDRIYEARVVTPFCGSIAGVNMSGSLGIAPKPGAMYSYTQKYHSGDLVVLIIPEEEVLQAFILGQPIYSEYADKNRWQRHVNLDCFKATIIAIEWRHGVCGSDGLPKPRYRLSIPYEADGEALIAKVWADGTLGKATLDGELIWNDLGECYRAGAAIEAIMLGDGRIMIMHYPDVPMPSGNPVLLKDLPQIGWEGCAPRR